MQMETRRWGKALVLLLLVGAVAWFGVQAGTRALAHDGNGYWGAGPMGMMGGGMMGAGMMGGGMDVADITDEQWQQMGELHAQIHGGDPAEAVEQMNAGHSAMTAMYANMAAMHGSWGTAAPESLPEVSQDAPRRQAELSMSEWKFAPKTLRGRDGEVLVLTIKNDGTIPHGFTAPELGVNIPPFAPGTSRTVEIQLKKGEYEIYCPVPGHKQLGQVGSITVE